MMSKNPLRISQESLDLDDIISDLNSEMQQNCNKGKIEVQAPQMKAASVMSTTSKKEVAANAKQIGTKAATSAKPRDKENDSLQANKQEITLQTIQKKEAMIAPQNTTDTKAQTSVQHSEHKPNQRYATESDLFSLPGEGESVDHNLRVGMPFYLKNASTAGDEDVETFQRKLDTLIVNFRSETMSEFMKTKKQVLQDQAQTIDAERRRCNTLLGVKQNEIEQLKESLANKTKQSEDLQTRCEGMSFWAGKSKTLLRIKLLQNRAFQALKSYRDFKKHSKRVLEHRLRQYREKVKREVYLGWEAQYRQWKVKKNREDFEKAVKLELQNICAQYNKEIESLREKLSEANAFVENEQRNRSLMQENLKKAFMRGVCALNFEAMNILHPSDAAGQIEREMERQMSQAMNQANQQATLSEFSMPSQRSTFTQQPVVNALSPRSEASSHNDVSHAENSEPTLNPFVSLVSQPVETLDYKRVDTKDTMWKPAPVMGSLNPTAVPTFTYVQPTITSQLKSTQQLQAPVLPSTFKTFTTDTVQVVSNPHSSVLKVEEDTNQRIVNSNPTVINNAASLPDFVHNGGQDAVGQGKTIVVNQTINHKTSTNKPTSTSTITSKKPTTASMANKKK